ncbi:MAG: hypothetical protein R3236_07530, partial [Phycisphaeraceae bacterium]|nr:hypothetical protein [Phycisphaeraceae bacterium]
MQCEEAELYLASLAFGELEAETDLAEQLQGHLAHCDGCREKLGDLRVTASLLAEAANAEPMPRLSDSRREKLVKRFRGMDRFRTEPTGAA